MIKTTTDPLILAMRQGIMTIQRIKGMTAAEMRSEAALFRSLASQVPPVEADAYIAVAEQIEADLPEVEAAERDAVTDYLAGIPSAQLQAELTRRERAA